LWLATQKYDTKRKFILVQIDAGVDETVVSGQNAKKLKLDTIDKITCERLRRVSKALKAEGCTSVCLAGIVNRPDFKTLKPDLKGASLLPGIVAAAMLSFALSLDDFIITYFVSGSTVTYPLYVNAATKAAVPPQINVLATAILVISLILLVAATMYRRKRIDIT
jgi:DUF1009 family protein